jgi:hypothetical protein
METALKWEPFIPAPIARSRGNNPELRPQKSTKKMTQAETTTASRPRKKIACMARNSSSGNTVGVGALEWALDTAASDHMRYTPVWTRAGTSEAIGSVTRPTQTSPTT